MLKQIGNAYEVECKCPADIHWDEQAKAFTAEGQPLQTWLDDIKASDPWYSRLPGTWWLGLEKGEVQKRLRCCVQSPGGTRKPIVGQCKFCDPSTNTTGNIPHGVPCDDNNASTRADVCDGQGHCAGTEYRRCDWCERSTGQDCMKLSQVAPAFRGKASFVVLCEAQCLRLSLALARRVPLLLCMPSPLCLPLALPLGVPGSGPVPQPHTPALKPRSTS